MKKGFLTLLAPALTLSLSSAQPEPTTPVLDHASPVAAPGYLGLSFNRGELRVRLSDVQAAHLSPKFQTVGLKQGQPDTGFRAVHADTSLTEIVNYYWSRLAELGFESSVATTDRYRVVYAFRNGERELTAIFTQQSAAVVADLSWPLEALATTAP
ncbi:MAG: hypothetical protein AVDCRST_MAG86-1503 [uncultured Truepera sp.]|uniref:Uncharacterized protein n=1 Tax=uncultured Truepera sp. TaxID=543023 RepID=A0A6J4UIP1_9DEIN|nr:MAG: hypothetical protein AVDCRST_MAG86-1503 [uncultured Truepera sp.]